MRYEQQSRPSRRAVITYGLAGLATVTVGGAGVLGSARRAAADVVDARLFVLTGERPMIDGVVVPLVGFGSTPERLELPSGQLEVETGDTVNLTVTNSSGVPVGFAIQDVVDAPPLAPGSTRKISFQAPARPGTHLYVGSVHGSAQTGRALGALGAMVVLPRGTRTSVDALFPGVRARTRRQPLFGRDSPARPPATIAQERTWLFSELDPTTARELAGGRVALPSDPEPEYFLVNGLSGVLAVEDHHTNITGRAGGLGTPGDATLVRMINAGRAPRSVHMHGNHFLILTHPDAPWLIGAFKDTVRIPPARVVDVLVPMETPPDSFPVVNRGQKYVVHDHIEMAQTASGGHYPAGMVTDVIFA